MNQEEEIFKTMGVELTSNVERIEKLLRDQEFHKLHSTIFERITILLISAMGLVAALAWDDALKEMFKRYIGALDTFQGKLFYAIFITILAVFISIFLGKIFLNKKSKF